MWGAWYCFTIIIKVRHSELSTFLRRFFVLLDNFSNDYRKQVFTICLINASIYLMENFHIFPLNVVKRWFPLGDLTLYLWLFIFCYSNNNNIRNNNNNNINKMIPLETVINNTIEFIVLLFHIITLWPLGVIKYFLPRQRKDITGEVCWFWFCYFRAHSKGTYV